MTPASPSGALISTQKIVATSQRESVATRYSELRIAVASRIDAIRAELSNEAPAGFHTRAATMMDWRRERISREVQRVEKLSVDLFLAEVALHREEGRPEIADRLLAALNEGQPLRIQTGGAVIIRISDGQLYLDLQSPEARS